MSDLELQVVDVAIGMAFWALAVLIPARAMRHRPALIWDAAAVISVTAFVVGAEMILGAIFDWGSRYVGAGGWYALVESTPTWVLVPAYILLADFGGYWAHRALHTRWLWNTHAWHHSPKYLYWAAGVRGSPIHVLVLYSPYALTYAVLPLPDIVIVLTGMAILDMANQHYIHSNMRWPFARQLECILVTPRSHFVHHSAYQPRTDSNYGFIFSFWDRLFGTWTDPDTVPADDPLGLDYEADNWRLLLGLPARRAPIKSGASSDGSAQADATPTAAGRV